MKNKAAVLLRHKFNEIKDSNPKFSLRAFALRCGISSGALSEVFKGKRTLSFKQCEKIADNLNLNPIERNSFLGSSRSENLGIRKVSFLSQKSFSIVSEGVYFDFLTLMDLQDFKLDTKWISAKLGITEDKVKLIVKRLKDIKLIEEEDNKLIKIKDFVYTSDDVKDMNIQMAHAETLKLAKESLFNDPVFERDFTSVCIPFDPANLAIIKEKIREFHMEIREIAKMGTPTEVYEFAIQFFPKTKNRKKVQKKTS